MTEKTDEKHTAAAKLMENFKPDRRLFWIFSYYDTEVALKFSPHILLTFAVIFLCLRRDTNKTSVTQMRPAQAKASLCVRRVWPKPSLFTEIEGGPWGLYSCSVKLWAYAVFAQADLRLYCSHMHRGSFISVSTKCVHSSDLAERI